MSNFGFNIPDSLKRNGNAPSFARPPTANPSTQEPQGCPPGFTNVFNKASFSNTLPTLNANSVSQAPPSSVPLTRVFGSNMANNNTFVKGFAFNKPSSSSTNGGFSKGVGAHQGNGPSTTTPSVGLSQNSKQQLMSVLGDKIKKSSADFLFNRKPLPTAPTFSQFNQRVPGSRSSPAKPTENPRLDDSKDSFEGFGGPRAKGTSTGFSFKHRSPPVNRFDAQAPSSSGGSIKTKKATALQKVQNRQNRANVKNIWADEIPSTSRTSKSKAAAKAQPISAMEPKKRRSSDDMALVLRTRGNVLERSNSNEGKSSASTAAMAIKRRNMRLPAQRNRQVANEMGLPKATIPRVERTKATISVGSLFQASKLQTLQKVDAGQSMKSSKNEDLACGEMANSLHLQLRALIGTNCETNVEKYQILKKRDELMYKTRTKNTDVSVMDITQGKCPDMCPEKERYMRETQKNLNRYECDQQGEMVPSLTVKDYSRSAADQEEPLPHELRPPHVLQMTMNYLMTKIANEIPSNASDLVKWYDFLWSRTRSIRKDITQQMLNDEVAVDLVEKCARFHVFASFRLASLSVADFNQKMNSENLSKCLQTLRHMYDDLAAEGIFCESESEFRSYDMILNLADSNVHSQVLSYRDAVRQSPDVQMALSLATSLQNNNYVQFFRQLRNHSSFLQACLCQHYFPLVRHSSLKTICYAYRLFPLDRFVEILAFDTATDAINFLMAFGIEMDQTDDSYIDVTEGRSIFAGRAPDPDSLATGRCLWLEMKIGGRSLAEVLSNGPCHPMEIPEPVDSFDASGCYTRDPFNPPSEQDLQQIQLRKEAAEKQQVFSNPIFSSNARFRKAPNVVVQQTKPFFSFAQACKSRPKEVENSTPVFSPKMFPSSQPKIEPSRVFESSKVEQSSPFSFNVASSKSSICPPAAKSVFPNSANLFNPTGKCFGQRAQQDVKLYVGPSATWSQVLSNGNKPGHPLKSAAESQSFEQKPVPEPSPQPLTFEIQAKLLEERNAISRAAEEAKHKAEIEAKQQAELQAKQQAEMDAKRKKDQLKLDTAQFAESQLQLIMSSLVERELELIATTVRAEAELFQERLSTFQDNLFRMWLRQFTDQWKSVVKRNKVLRSISIRQREGITIAKARRSLELCSPSSFSMPQPKRRRITAEEMELCLYVRHYNAVRTKQLAKVYFSKWRRFVVDRRKKNYFESFFIQAAYMGSYENGKWTSRCTQQSEG